MKWNVGYESELGIVRARQWDDFTLDDEFKFLETTVSDPHASQGAPLMFDYTQLVVTNIGSNDLEQISKRLGDLIQRIASKRIALLAATDLQYGLGRQFQIISESRIPTPIHVFRDEAAALTWLRESDA
jgi:hypothetical protein